MESQNLSLNLSHFVGPTNSFQIVWILFVYRCMLTVIVPICLFVGVPANIVTIGILMKMLKKSSREKNVILLYFIWIVTSDTVHLLSKLLPEFIIIKFQILQWNYLSCKLVYWFQTVSDFQSSWLHVILIAIRFFSLVHSNNLCFVRVKSMLPFLSVVLLICAVFLNSHYINGVAVPDDLSNMQPSAICQLNTKLYAYFLKFVWFWIVHICFYALPLFLVGLNIILVIKTMRSKKSHDGTGSTSELLSLASNNNVSCMSVAILVTSVIFIMVMLQTLTTAFVARYYLLPFQDDFHNASVFLVYNVGVLTLCMYYSAKFFILCATSRSFRHTLRRLLGSRIRRECYEGGRVQRDSCEATDVTRH